MIYKTPIELLDACDRFYVLAHVENLATGNRVRPEAIEEAYEFLMDKGWSDKIMDEEGVVRDLKAPPNLRERINQTLDEERISPSHNLPDPLSLTVSEAGLQDPVLAFHCWLFVYGHRCGFI